MLDSAASIVAAVRRSVRRWRLARVASIFPTAVPQECDAGIGGSPTILLHLACAFGPLTQGRTFEVKTVPERNPALAADLQSAMCNGQWPQARRAMVPKWEATNKCQLCLAAVGTLEHRHVCNVTVPSEGWPPPPGGRVHQKEMWGR